MEPDSIASMVAIGLVGARKEGRVLGEVKLRRGKEYRDFIEATPELR